MMTDPGENVLYIGDLVMDRFHFEVRLGNQEIHLTRREFEVLWVLSTKPGKTFTREELRAAAWSQSLHIEARTADVHILKLRKKLKRHGRKIPLIETIWGIGYRIKAFDHSRTNEH